jgi:hypothetical protein
LSVVCGHSWYCYLERRIFGEAMVGSLCSVDSPSRVSRELARRLRGRGRGRARVVMLASFSEEVYRNTGDLDEKENCTVMGSS